MKEGKLYFEDGSKYEGTFQDEIMAKGTYHYFKKGMTCNISGRDVVYYNGE